MDCELFLDTLGQACARTGWIVHGYVLMVNHIHGLIETPEPNLSVGMKWLQSTYTQRFNRRHRECGHLFQGRYKALSIDPDAQEYFHECRAEALKQQGLKALGLRESDLLTLRKGSAEKMVLVWFIKRQTAVSNAWLSQHLHCGHPANIPGYTRAVEAKQAKRIQRFLKVLTKNT